MNRTTVATLSVVALALSGWTVSAQVQGAQTIAPAAMSGEQLADELHRLEVSSISDAMEQLFGQTNYMSHTMRPLAPTKFAGPAVTVMMRKEEHRDGAKASQGMLDAIDMSPAGSVYVMVLEDGQNIAGIGGIMATAMKARGFAGAVIDGGVRDIGQIQKIQFPVFSRSVVPSTSINHYRFAGSNIRVTAGGVRVSPGDIIVADPDGIAVVPRARAAEVLVKARELENTEHSMYPFIARFRSVKEAVARFGRI